MQTSVRYTLSDFILLDNPSHRLNGRKTGRAIGELGNFITYLNTRSFKKRGSLIKKPGNPIGR